MKVLHVDTGTKWRGGQAQIHNLLTHFTEGDLENHLLCPPDSTLLERFNDSNSSSSTNSQLPTLHTHPLRGEWDVSASWEIRSLNKKHTFDLIHAHSSHALGITWMASLLFDVPPFIETRRLDTPVAQNFLSKMKYSATDHHIANSETVKESLIYSGIDPKQITVIPSGINLSKIRDTEANPRILRELGLDPDQPVIGNVGALCDQKDQKTFVDVANAVLEEYPETQFVIAGEGELWKELEQRIREFGIRGSVKLAGFVDDIVGLMKTFDVFLFTSLYEGLCGTLLQIMACKVPIVTTDIEGSQQIITPGETCLVADIGDVPQLSQHVKELLNLSRSQYAFMVQNALQVAKNYNYSKLAKETARFYTRVSSN